MKSNMSKVLISFLGTGISNSHRYESVRYEIGGQEYRTTLISEAISKHYCINKIIFIGTVRSMWEEVYDRFAKINAVEQDDDYVESLLDFIDDAKMNTDIDLFPDKTKIEKVLGGDSRIVLIDYGIDKEQLKANTEKILQLEQYLEPFDELIIDVTHGFRSLPLTIMNLLVYLKNVSDKSIDISHILYGMRDIKDEECIPLKKKKDIVPVIDLNDGDMGVMNINKWITGAYAFKEFGKGKQIADLLKEKYSDLSTKLNNISDIQSLNYLKELADSIQDFIKTFENNESKLTLLEKMALEPSVKELINYGLNNSSVPWKFQLNLSRWQYKKKNYIAAYITLAECVISYVCTNSINVVTNKRFNSNSYTDREIVKGKNLTDKYGKELNPSGHNYIADYPDIYKVYEDDGLRIIRNALAHNKPVIDKNGKNVLNFDSKRNINNIDAQLKNFINRLMFLLK